jgi:hypothetical protein
MEERKRKGRGEEEKVTNLDEQKLLAEVAVVSAGVVVLHAKQRLLLVGSEVLDVVQQRRIAEGGQQLRGL